MNTVDDPGNKEIKTVVSRKCAAANSVDTPLSAPRNGPLVNIFWALYIN